jgi:hypothetical protein
VVLDVKWRNDMNKVAVLYICTGEYWVFWKDFYLSYEKYFLKASEIHYYVFTEAENLEGEENPRVHKIYQEVMGWPNDTLLRFKLFMSIREELEGFDYLFFMNANCKCVAPITEEVFLPTQEEGLLVVRHHSYYNKDNRQFTYDRNPKSRAYIPMGEGEVYVFGAVNGGTSSAFLRMAEELERRTDLDLEDGVVALWHDESHLNRYIIDYPNYRLLSPSYGYPEDWDLPFEPKIITRDKTRVIDVYAIKGIKPKKNNSVKALLGRIVNRLIR